MEWLLKVPDDFKFETAVTGHGWYRLAPFHYLDEEKRLLRVEELSTRRVICFSMVDGGNQTLRMMTQEILTEQELGEINQKVRWMLRLDEDFTPFYSQCLDKPEMAYVANEKHGRLLRSSTLFEDFVKVMLTTNTTWTRTITMTAAIVEKLGNPCPERPDLRAFPKPQAFVDKGAAYLKDEIRLGYRSEYIYDLAFKVLNGELDLDGMLDQERSTEVIVQQLQSIKGIGPYAQSTLLMILGIYDQLPVDSEFRKHVRTKYFHGKDPTPKQIASLYKEWENYKYLAYWFDRKA
jgi:3-methyladenine DNA glycosylase/8-oxoguanine DNA glycosylase